MVSCTVMFHPHYVSFLQYDNNCLWSKIPASIMGEHAGDHFTITSHI